MKPIKNLSILLIFLFSSITFFGQEIHSYKIDKLSDEYNFIGQINQDSYFNTIDLYKRTILKIDASGNTISKTKVKIPKYHKAEVKFATTFIYKNALYYIGYTRMKKKTSHWVVVKAEEDGSIANEPTLLFTSRDDKRLGESAVANNVQLRIINDQVYLLAIRRVHYRKVVSRGYVVKFDETLIPEVLFGNKLTLPEDKVIGTYDFAVSENYAFINVRGNETGKHMMILDYKTNEVRLSRFNLKERDKFFYVNGSHIDIETNDLFIMSNRATSKGHHKYMIVDRYNKELKLLSSEKIDLDDLPSAKSYYTSNGIGVEPGGKGLITALGLIDIDKAGEILRMSFEFRAVVEDYTDVGNRNYAVTNETYYFNEVFVLGISTNSGRKKWSTLINKEQKTSWGSFKKHKHERHYVGTHVVRKGEDLIYLFNDHIANSNLAANARDIELWEKPENTNVVAIQLDSEGNAIKKVVSKEEGVNIYFESWERTLKNKQRGINKGNEHIFLLKKEKSYRGAILQ